MWTKGEASVPRAGEVEAAPNRVEAAPTMVVTETQRQRRLADHITIQPQGLSNGLGGIAYGLSRVVAALLPITQVLLVRATLVCRPRAPIGSAI